MILTDEDIGRIGIGSQQGLSPHEDAHAFARAVEASVIARMVAVDVEPAAGRAWLEANK